MSKDNKMKFLIQPKEGKLFTNEMDIRQQW